MISRTTTTLLLLAIAAGVMADVDTELVDFKNLDEATADPRLFFTNFTSSLVQVNATILAYALLGLAILAAGAVALYYLYLESQNSSSGGYGQKNGDDYGGEYAYAR
jgi:hypothetical protein